MLVNLSNESSTPPTSLSSMTMEITSVSKPGEVILCKLFHEFTLLTEKKLENVLTAEPLEKPLAKSLQRGEDAIFDQLLIAFGTVAEHCLPSQLRMLFKWYDRQMSATAVFFDENQRIIKWSSDNAKDSSSSKSNSLTKSNIQSLDNSDIEIYYTLEKRDLAVEFIFCLVLIEVLKQLPLHPGYEELTSYIENLAFKHFKFREDAQSNPNLVNINMIADLYAEVIGVLAQSRFQSVRKRFMNEFTELRVREPGPIVTHSIISLLMGMKFFRIKMVPIEEFEASFKFMQECANYFLEVKDKDIKHALAGLFVEILVPVAATVKNEVNVPCLKNFVEILYSPCLDLCTKKKHCLALFPLVTCLLCVSQKTFFLSNWHYFLAMCLSHLKNRDTKMSRVALESLYRLLWVYMIRIKCESNTATQTRLHSIVNSLFPKGSKNVVPRDTPLNIFVKIIQFIAQERLDFAMKEIVFDLLSVNRPIKMVLTPERMSIGLRSFLVVADSLQQKDGEPPMPRTLGVLPSGNTLRVKKTFLNKMLTDEMAKNIGMNHYYPFVRKTLGDILRALDIQFGRPLMITTVKQENVNKEPDDMLSGERKPKIDLFRTCVAAIPRLIPDGISKNDLIDLLSRLTINIDEEMNVLAFQALQNLVVDFSDWREDVIDGFVHFIIHEINDAFQELIANALRMLLQLLTSWKNILQQQNNVETRQQLNPKLAQVLYQVEALGLVMLCHCRQPTRRLASYILKEVRLISSYLLSFNQNYDFPVLHVIDEMCPLIIESCFPYISSNEKATILSMSSQVDLQWLAERTSQSWIFLDRSSEQQQQLNLKSTISSVSTITDANKLNYLESGLFDAPNNANDDQFKLNAWNVCLMSLMSYVTKHCPNTVVNAWPIICQRSNTLFTYIDPNPVNDNRASSILRPTSTVKRVVSPYDRSFYLELWKNYLVFACSIAPSSSTSTVFVAPKYPSMMDSCVSPDSILDRISNNTVTGAEGSRSPMINNRGISAQSFFKQILPLLRSEHGDLRAAVVLGLSQVNHYALADLLEVLIPYFREAIDKKQENVRRRKRREMLRVQIGRLFKLISERKIFAQCPMIVWNDVDHNNHSSLLSQALIEYIEGVRLYFETDSNITIDSKDSSSTNRLIVDIKESFCHFVCHLLKSLNIDNRSKKLSKELRKNLFHLFATWSGDYGRMFLIPRHHHSSSKVFVKPDFSKITELEFLAVRSMSAILCAGEMFDAKHLLAEPSSQSLYWWLESLLVADDKRLNDTSLETLILLLENNCENGALLDWVIECCYTKSAQIADACFTALATIFFIREYPCDRYIAVIIVTIINVDCPRIEIQQLALQLLQVLDNRFFSTISSPLNNISKEIDGIQSHNQHQADFSAIQPEKFCDRHSLKDFEPLLVQLYPCSLIAISERMAHIRPQLTMIVFSEITYRFQTARSTVRQSLLSFLTPWLYNMQLVDTTVSFSAYSNHYGASTFSRNSINGGNVSNDDVFDSYGWGSIESTQMVLNNLLFITMKFGEDHDKELEKVWASLCLNRPLNLKIIIRYLFILTGLAPNELLPYAKRIAIYFALSQPERVIDELMSELQTVEFLNFNAERTEAFPYFRIINRKSSAIHLDEDNSNQTVSTAPMASNIDNPEQNHHHGHSRKQSIIGTLHTKRHSKDLHNKYGQLMDANENARAISDGLNESGSSVEDYNLYGDLLLSVNLNKNDESLLPDRHLMLKPSTPQPRPLPMPEYGGYYAPLNDLLGNKDVGWTFGGSATPGQACQVSTIPSQQQSSNIGFHRCNLALMLLTDIVTQDISVDWSPHLPLMLHILFLGMDHSKVIVYEHCKQLLVNLLIVCCHQHQDNLTVAKVLLKNRILSQDYGLSIQMNSLLSGGSNDQAVQKNTELDLVVEKIFSRSNENLLDTSPNNVNLNDIQLNTIPKEEDDLNKISPSDKYREKERKTDSSKAPKFSLNHYIMSLIDWISSKQNLQLWSNEDITAKVWSVRSIEQMTTYVQFVLCVFKESHPTAKIENRWADIALQLALSCSSRHYAGRSLQIFRALKIPINTRMLSDILSRLVETVSEQGEDMQGYVTELMLTLESAIDILDLKPPNIFDLINEYFRFYPEDDEIDSDSNLDIRQEDEHKCFQMLDNTGKVFTSQTSVERTKFISSSKIIKNGNLRSTESSCTLVAGPNGMAITDLSKLHQLKKSYHNDEDDDNGGAGNNRNTSYSMSFPTRLKFIESGNHAKPTSTINAYPRLSNQKEVDDFYSSSKIRRDSLDSISTTVFGRSQSAQSLNNIGISTTPAYNEKNLISQDAMFENDENFRTSMLAQFFWIAVLLLESDYEHEFLLALRLLDKVMQKISLDDEEFQENIEKIFDHFKWSPPFLGVHQMLLKGLTAVNSFEPTMNLLYKFTPYLRCSVVDPTKSETSFPFHVMAMLPFLLHNYDEPNALCTQAAVSFAQWCNECSDKNLENLAAVMTLYSKRCFSKENSQWTKCVVKYLYDAYPLSFVGIFSFLVEVAEKGPSYFLNHILSILHFMLHYIDLNSIRSINEDLLRVTSKYIEGSQWKDTLKILKLIVTRSSTLAAPSYHHSVGLSVNSSSSYASSIISSIVSCGVGGSMIGGVGAGLTYSDGISLSSASTFADSEYGSSGGSGMNRRELPGRTMDFIFDISKTPIVGSKFIEKRQALQSSKNLAKDQTNLDATDSINKMLTSTSSRSDFVLDKLFDNYNASQNRIAIEDNLSDKQSNGNNVVATSNVPTIESSTLKRNVLASQTRIRERLVSLLNRCGQRIGLPKSPSVIFSQNSDVIEHNKSSMASSVEDVSATNNDVSGDSKHDDVAPGEFYFKEFDFLEYELESQDGESLDNFNWGVRRKSLSNIDNDDHSVNHAIKTEVLSDLSRQIQSGAQTIITGSYSPMSPATSNKSHKTTASNANDELLESSEDEEVESVSPLYEIAGSSHAVLIGVVQDSSTAAAVTMNSLNQSRPSSLVSHGSSHSLISEPEFSSVNTEPCFSNTVAHAVSTSVTLVTGTPSIDTGVNNKTNLSRQGQYWSLYFIKMISDQTGSTLSYSNRILTQILRQSYTDVIGLTRDCCEFLLSKNVLAASSSSKNQYESLASRFLDLLDMISIHMDFPFVHIGPKLILTVVESIGATSTNNDHDLYDEDSSILSNGSSRNNNRFLMEKYRFTIMELQAHWETFSEKKEILIEFIDQIRKVVINQQLSMISKLCKHLYKMHFQLFLLYECYLKFVDFLKSIISTNHVQITNRSTEIVELKKKLVKCFQRSNQEEEMKFDETTCQFNSSGSINEIESSTMSSSIKQKNNGNNSDVMIIRNLLLNKQYIKAIELLAKTTPKLRNSFLLADEDDDNYGAGECDDNEDDDDDDANKIQTLLSIYCQTVFGSDQSDLTTLVNSGDSGSWLVITEPEYSMIEITRQLMETSLIISNILS